MSTCSCLPVFPNTKFSTLYFLRFYQKILNDILLICSDIWYISEKFLIIIKLYLIVYTYYIYYLVLKLSNKMLIFIDNLFMQKSQVTFSVLCIIVVPIYRINYYSKCIYVLHVPSRTDTYKRNAYFYWQSLDAKISGNIFCYIHNNRSDLQNYIHI